MEANKSIMANRREANLISLYKIAFPAVAKYISRKGGSFEEAKDVFHDALVIYYEQKIATSKILTNEIGFLVGISKNLWLKRYRDYARHTVPLGTEGTDIIMEYPLLPASKRLIRFLEIAGKKCMELLKAFYYDQLPLTDIAEEFGYSGKRSATAQKFKCLEKVREKVKEKALQYDDFIE